MGKVISIQLKLRDYFRGYLQLVSNFPPYNCLLKKELELLSELYYLDYGFKQAGVAESLRGQLLLGPSTRLKIREVLSMSSGALNTNLYQLRKKNFLTEDNQIVYSRCITPETHDQIGFKFTLQSETGTTNPIPN